MEEKVKNITEGEAKDMILKYCVENVGIHSVRDIKENLFPEIDLDLIKLLFEKISNSADPILNFRGERQYISANGITPVFLKQGGYTKSEIDEKAILEKSDQKENLEEQIRKLTRDNLRLGNWDIRFRWYIAVITFILGFIIKYFIDK
jgi:hypothetical protein